MWILNPTGEFKYQPLAADGHEFRLLSIEPATSSSSPIECILENTSLVDAPAYEALSYCWGSPEPAHIILVNGSPFNVTPNLKIALSQLRENGHYRIWVDA